MSVAELLIRHQGHGGNVDRDGSLLTVAHPSQTTNYFPRPNPRQAVLIIAFYLFACVFSDVSKYIFRILEQYFLPFGGMRGMESREMEKKCPMINGGSLGV